MVKPILTVLVPAETIDLTTLDTVKEEFGLKDSSQDSKMQRWITEVSAEIADWCGRTLALEKVQEEFPLNRAKDRTWDVQPRLAAPDEPAPLHLSRWPVAEVASVVVDGSSLATTDYEIDASSGQLYRLSSGARSDWSGSRIVVVYSGGFSLIDGLPYTIEQAALDCLRHRKAASSRDPAVRSEAMAGVYSATYWVGDTPGSEGSIPPAAVSKLMKYREAIIA